MRLYPTATYVMTPCVGYTHHRQLSSMGLASIRREADVEEDEDLSECTRCESMVDTETLVRLADWSVCEECLDDI